MTPDGLGIHLRQPSLLKYLSRLRGSKVEETPFYDKYVFVENQKDDEDSLKNQFNELQMIINEKLWKGEDSKRRRRAKRT